VYMYRTSDGIESETGGQYARNGGHRAVHTTFSALAMHTTKELASA